MSNTISYGEFKKDFFRLQGSAPTYRIGQHFINCFIKQEDNTTKYTVLWNKRDINTAEQLIFELINQLQWDINNLIKVRDF